VTAPEERVNGDDTGDDHDGRDVRDVTVFLVVFIVVVAIVPEARQPSVVVHIEQAPRYPFSGRKGDGPAKFAANAFTNVLRTLALIGFPAKGETS
jgi:hypothetical protein